MKKIYILTAVFALLTLSLNAQLKVDGNGNVVQPKSKAGKVNAPSRAATQVTVCDGTNTNTYVPFYGLYFDDNYQINQMIYPESLLTNLVGKTITSVTFYARSNFSSNIGSGKFTFKIGTTTNQTTFSNPITRITTGMTAVATNMSMSTCISGSQLIIDFSDNPFTYQGGNLVLDYELTTLASGYNTTYFYGENNHTNASFYSRSTSNSPNGYGVYSNSSTQNFLPKVTFGAEDAGPKIEVSPESLTINDSGTNNTFTVQGSNLGSDNVGVTVPDGSGFTRTTDDQNWGFVNNNGSVSGTATIGYEGRDLSASTTVSVGNNLTSTTVAVTYRADLYIVGDFGNGWDFSTGTPMTYNSDDNTYTATVTVDDNNLILFARKLGESNPWNTRLVFGPNSDGDWWVTGDNANGTIDLYDDDPIKIVNSGTYTVTINATTGALTIEKLVLPPPENVVATADSENQKATVTWDAPSNLPSKSVTEDFEDTSVFPPFSTGGIDATTHTGAFGDWTLYDATGGCVVYGSKQLDYDNENEPHAWFVFKPSGATASSDYPNAVAHDSYSGAQYLESICPTSSTSAAGVSDHWLISPKLSGNAQTISFYVSEMTTQYGDETYEIWVSTTDNNPSSFTQLGGTYNVSLDIWAEQSVQLPAGTKYFAIRHTSNDVFGLLIDDLTYEVAINPVSYNVYLDGVLVGNVDANDPLTYDFSNLAVGDHECAVSAVYPGGIESEDVPATFNIMARTATPTINVVANADGSKTISATGDGTVHLYVDGVEVTNPYTIMPSPDGDMAYTVTATAQEEGKLISETAEQIVTVAEAGRTPTPVIDVDEQNGYVVITATGDGTVTLTVDGQTVTGEGSASITIVKSFEEQNVTATATAQDGDLAESHPATLPVTIPALNTTPTNPESGLLRLHLLIVDQMKEEIPADNSHPDRYSYVLRYEPNGVGGDGTKESGTVQVDIQKADCEVMGAYTLNEIDNDTNIGINHDQGVKMNVISADVEYDLSSDNDILYAYLLQGAENRVPGYQADFLTELQKTQNFTYVEMLESNPNKGQEYQNGEHHFFVGEENLKTGDYGSSYMSYAPSVSTWGISRRYYEDDGYDNTYGAPIWKTGAGQVKMDNNAGTITLKAERQTNTSHSVNWTDENGQAASVYILDGINAVGKLPHSDITTIEYEPYMFRIFVESPNGKLRNYQFVDADPANTTQPGEHAEGVTTSEADSKGPLCVWSGYIKYGEDEQGNKIMLDDPENGVSIETGVEDGQTTYIYHKVKVDRPEPTTETDPETGETTTTVSPWTQNKQNAMFGALDDVAISGFNQNGEPITKTEIDPNDLTVFVRFYFNVKGMADDHVVAGREGDSSRPGNGSESPGFTPEPWTAVNEVVYNGEVVSRTYVNSLGMQSDQPFDGVNIVITRYSDGKVSTTKVVR